MPQQPHRNFPPSFRAVSRRVRQTARTAFGKSISATNGVLHNPFFIVGSGRSGTTLLRRILCSNPEIHIPPELPLSGLIKLHDRYGKLRWRDFVYLTMPDRSIVKRLVNLPKEEQSLATIVAAIAENDAQQKGIQYKRWGDKTPFNFNTMNEIMLMFPDARFIHSYRDGCDVVQSRVTAELTDYQKSAKIWVNSIKKVEAFAHQNRIYSLRYEDLVASPEKYAREVCQFLDIDFSPDMLEVNEQAKSAMSEEANKAYHANLHTPVTANKVGKGRDAIPREELEKLAPIMDPWLLKLGYRPCLDTKDTP